MQGSEVRSQSPIQCQAPPVGVFREEGDRGSAGKPQAGGWAGRQAPKNLTCDPGRPHRLKGLRDAEAGSVMCVCGYQHGGVCQVGTSESESSKNLSWLDEDAELC